MALESMWLESEFKVILHKTASEYSPRTWFFSAVLLVSSDKTLSTLRFLRWIVLCCASTASIHMGQFNQHRSIHYEATRAYL